VPLVDHFGLCGQVLDGQFRVDQPIGEGGFSVVYKGHHIGLDEPIAIKCLKLPGALGSAVVESFVRRFRDESRIHYKLTQGNLYITRSIASGTTMAPVTGALVPYMVLEWLEGRSLAAEFNERRAQGHTGRPLAEAVKLLDPAIDALAYAHAKGVVHRDINPGNLFLTKTGDGVKVKVLDFGVAKIVSDHAMELGPRAATLGHIRIFSPAYAAPEQFDDRAGKIGPWTDVYAIVLVLLETARDRTVNDGEHLGEYAMRALDPVNRPTPRSLGIAVGEEVERLLARAVALDTSDRPQDAGELWGMLKHAMKQDGQSGQPAHARRASGAPPSFVATSRDVQAAPSMPNPAVEVVRPQSAAPPAMKPGVTRPMGVTQPMKPDAPARPRAPVTTVRMATAPSGGPLPELEPSTVRTGSAALALTPTPGPAVVPLTPLPAPTADDLEASMPVIPPPPGLPGSAQLGGWPPSQHAQPVSPPRSRLSMPPPDALAGANGASTRKGSLVLIAVAVVMGIAAIALLVFFGAHRSAR
jgi:serine/threonine protein kinase